MSRRAFPAAILLVVSMIGIVLIGRDTDPAPTPFFSETGGTWMPAVGASGSLTGSWFCPGVPATGEAGVGGSVVVSNRDDAQLVGRYMILTDDGVVADREFSVGPWAQTRIDVDATVPDPTAFASIVVEIDGGGGFVEQIANHPAGNSVAACSNNTSPTWYLADGFTVDGSVDTLVLTNPFDEPVVANLRFSTEERESQPGQFKGFTVLPRTVRTIPIAELGARDEPIIAVSVEATAGRLVVGRAQHYVGGGRLGYDVSLAAPELRDQWWFADGERNDGISETYSIYNPTDDDVEVTVFFGGLPLDAGVEDLDPIVIGPRRVVVFDPYADPTITGPLAGDDAFTPVDGDEAGDDGSGDGEFVDFATAIGEIPLGRHSTVFSTLAQPSIVVERVLTRPAGDSVATSVVMGAPPRPDGYVASVWHMGVGPTVATEQALVVYNIDQSDATVTVEAVGPGGPSVVPSLSEIPLAPGSIITIDLVDPDVLGQELIVSSTSRVFVERLLPRGGDLEGRSGSFLLPASN
jgi:Family of unknown function (DUF5719)